MSNFGFKKCVLFILVCIFIFAYSKAKSDDNDFSSPEKLFETFVHAYQNQDIEQILLCYDEHALTILGKTSDQRKDYINTHIKDESIKFKNAELKEVRFTFGKAGFDAIIFFTAKEKGKQNNTYILFCRKIEDKWLLTP